jgi:predicted MFS family arabinose efflux permease
MKLRHMMSGGAGLVLAAGFMALFIGSARFVMGLTLKPMVDEMNWTRTDIGEAVGLFQVVTALAMFAGGRMADTMNLRYIFGFGLGISGLCMIALGQVTQPWHVLVIFGIVYAFANGVAAMASVGVMVTRAFPLNAGFANGVASSGMSVGQLVIISILAAVLVTIGWRSVFFWVGLAHFIVLPFIIYACPGKVAMHNERKGPPREGMTLGEAARTRQFWMLIVIFAICGLDDFFVSTHVVAFAQDRGLDALLAGNLLAFMGVVGLIGVITAGVLGDRKGPVFGTALAFGARIAVFLLVMLDQSTLSVTIFAVVFGFTFLMTAPLTVLFIRDSFGLKNLGTIGGIIVMVHHIFGGIGAWLGAAVYDSTGAYTHAFTVMMLASILAFVVTILYKPSQQS